jgi:integrase
MSSSLINVLEFLAFLASNGKAYSTINVARSMLSTTLATIDGIQIGKHPLVTKLMDGIFNLNPPKPKYQSTWNVDVVLDYLKTIPDNENLNLSQISHKLVILLALTTLLRVSEIASIARQSITFFGDKVTFSLSEPRKAQHDGALHSLTLQKYLAEPKLCPVSCLGYYIYLTDAARNDTNSQLLLMATIRPFKPVTGSTVGRWIKCILTEAGVDPIFSAHSTRGAAASRAEKNGIPIDTILKTAHWAQESTFTKFYKRQTVDPLFENAVLGN